MNLLALLVGHVHQSVASISEAIAERLLKTGFVEADPFGDDGGSPQEIYNLYRGIPYVAVPTQPGKSYPGYPWRGRMSASIRMKLELRAEDSGYLKEFNKWLKKYHDK
ncbi:MAG: hypothetical protein ACNA8W_06435 [Bradymonadaceae bacterium]